MRYVMLGETFQNDLMQSKWIPDQTKSIGLWFPYDTTLETTKIRDRLDGASKGSGPFFGANISQSTQNFWLGYESGPKRWHFVTCNFEVQAVDTSNVLYRWLMDDGDKAYNLFLTTKMHGYSGHSQLSGSIYRNMRELVLKYSIDIIFPREMSKEQLKQAAYKVASINARWMTQSDFATTVKVIFNWEAEVRVALNYNWLKANLWSDNLRDYVQVKPPSIVYDHWYSAQSAWEWSTMSNHDASGYSAALERAVENLPQSTVNTAENMLDVVDGIKSIFESVMTGNVLNLIPDLRPSKIFSSAEDAWMAYRYMYSTSKSDLEEYAHLTSRLADLLGKPRFKAYGTFVDGFERYQCEMILSTGPMIPKDFRDWLSRYGLRLSTANAWDMVPYSFVVDWFLGLGSLFEQMDRAGEAVGFRRKACWYSKTYEYNGVNTYTRLPASSVPAFQPRITFHQASKKTLVKRFIDGVCLIGG